MSITVRMIMVSPDGNPMPDQEVGRAIVDDDGHVVYDGDTDGNIMKSFFENNMKARKMTAKEFATLANKDGWSNGYIMIDTAGSQ